MLKKEQNALFEERLKTVAIENGEILSIDFVLESIPEQIPGVLLPILPEHCRISVKLTPSPESDIRVELFLPIHTWNGDFLGTGNGGWAGSITVISAYMGLKRGYASANTDMGGELNPDELIGKRERWEDFGHRATHLMTVVSKQLIRAFYGKNVKHSYFVGGSTGGQQALMEAQRYPDDYDGIIAFCPAYNRVRLHTFLTWIWKAMAEDPEIVFAKSEIEAITNKVLELYREASGSAPGDRFLSYPGKIKVDLNGISDIFESMGFSQKQRNALIKTYEGPVDPVTGERLFAPMPFGCEYAVLMLPAFREGFAKLAGCIFRWVFGSHFDISTFDFHTDFHKTLTAVASILDATNPDLSAFQKKGGKLLLISGSMDALIPYTDTLNYYKQVVENHQGLENTVSFCRYFHIPGLGHGTGGVGFQEIGAMCGAQGMPLDPEHDTLSAIALWVEKGKAPERLLPVAFEDGDMTKAMSHDRPVYPYPYETEYVSGDPKNRESFRKKLGDGSY